MTDADRIIQQTDSQRDAILGLLDIAHQNLGRSWRAVGQALGLAVGDSAQAIRKWRNGGRISAEHAARLACLTGASWTGVSHLVEKPDRMIGEKGNALRSYEKLQIPRHRQVMPPAADFERTIKVMEQEIDSYWPKRRFGHQAHTVELIQRTWLWLKELEVRHRSVGQLESLGVARILLLLPDFYSVADVAPYPDLGGYTSIFEELRGIVRTMRKKGLLNPNQTWRFELGALDALRVTTPALALDRVACLLPRLEQDFELMNEERDRLMVWLLRNKLLTSTTYPRRGEIERVDQMIESMSRRPTSGRWDPSPAIWLAEARAAASFVHGDGDSLKGGGREVLSAAARCYDEWKSVGGRHERLFYCLVRADLVARASSKHSGPAVTNELRSRLKEIRNHEFSRLGQDILAIVSGAPNVFSTEVRKSVQSMFGSRNVPALEIVAAMRPTAWGLSNTSSQKSDTRPPIPSDTFDSLHELFDKRSSRSGQTMRARRRVA